MIDARRDRVYTALFESKKGKITRLTPDTVLSFAELDAALKKRGRVCYLTGNACEKAASVLTFSGARLLPEALREISAYRAGLLALEKYAADPALALPEDKLLPVYLGQTQAERERIEKESMKG